MKAVPLPNFFAKKLFVPLLLNKIAVFSAFWQQWLRQLRGGGGGGGWTVHSSVPTLGGGRGRGRKRKRKLEYVYNTVYSSWQLEGKETAGRRGRGDSWPAYTAVTLGLEPLLYICTMPKKTTLKLKIV